MRRRYLSDESREQMMMITLYPRWCNPDTGGTAALESNEDLCLGAQVFDLPRSWIRGPPDRQPATQHIASKYPSTTPIPIAWFLCHCHHVPLNAYSLYFFFPGSPAVKRSLRISGPRRHALIADMRFPIKISLHINRRRSGLVF